MKPGRNVRRLHDGSALVAKRIGWAFVPKDRPVATVIRCGALYWIGPGLLDLAHQSPVWLVGATCAWCVAAWRAKPQKTAEAEAADQSETSAYTDDEVRHAVDELVRNAVVGRNGVHVAELLAELQRVGYLDAEITVAELRRALERWDILTRDSVKVGGVNKPGVHRDDLQPLLQPLPEPALADAG